MAREIYAWSKCKHPNVHQLVGVATFRDQICIVSSWMQNGSLVEYLASKPSEDRYRMVRGFDFTKERC